MNRNLYRLRLCSPAATLLALLLAAAPLAAGAAEESLVLHDPLTSAELTKGAAGKKAHGGEYTARGWRALKKGDFLLIELAAPEGFEGALEIELRDLDWKQANTSLNQQKIQFLGMFSNPRAELHVEGGGTNRDALWSLRGGTAPDGGPAYGNRFAVLQASRGAKRAEPSDFEESVAPMVPGWKWEKRDYTFRVTWSKRRGELCGYVDGTMMFHEPWVNQVTPLRYIYIAKGPDFGTLVGPSFANLRVFGPPAVDKNVNHTPTISLLKPRNGGAVASGDAVEFEADVSDDGTVRGVEFFIDDRKVGEAARAPYTLRLPNLKDGWYRVTAKATDDRGGESTANPKYITVGQPWQPWGYTQPAKP